MNSISRLVAPKAGEIFYEGVALHRLPAHQMIRHGISHVLERHRLFPYMTVRENLLLGAGPGAARAALAEGLAHVFGIFPRLKERLDQSAHTLSGGEQQMCAIGRGLMSSPRLLLVDEPFIGLSPLLRDEVTRALAEINGRGVALLIIEQNVREAVRMSRRAYVLQAGRMALEGPSAEMLDSEAVEAVFFGRDPAVPGGPIAAP
jgi:branched-chain amino acid transport system ATP-binding protein